MQEKFDYGNFVPNPSFAFLWMQIGGEEITIENNRPTSWLSWTYNKNFCNQANTFVAGFFDPEWDRIETLILQNTENNYCPVSFRYGYTTGLQSDTYEGCIMTYSPSFEIDGVSLSIAGFTSFFRKDQVEKSGGREFVDADGYGLSIEKIVELLATEMGYTADVEPCEPVPDNDHMHSANVGPKKFVQRGQTNAEFIRTVLLPAAVKKGDQAKGTANPYIFASDDYRKKLIFKPADYEQSPVVTYSYLREKDSPVISFSPKVQTSIILRKGAGVTGLAYFDKQTGVYDKMYHNNATTPGKILLGGPYCPTQDLIDEQFSINMSMIPPRDAEQADTIVRNRYGGALNSCYGATLVIQGDPTVTPGKIIEVLMLTPDGKRHYTSGPYLITSVVDSIRGGNFTTTIELARNAAAFGKDPGTGKPLPAQGPSAPRES